MNKFDVFAHFLTVLKYLLYLIISGEIFLKYKVLEETKPYKFPKTANIDECFENFPNRGLRGRLGILQTTMGFFFEWKALNINEYSWREDSHHVLLLTFRIKWNFFTAYWFLMWTLIEN